MLGRERRKLRTEQKYYLHIHDYLSLRNRLSSVMDLDKHSINEEGYNIRSLYFDDPHRTALTTKNDGIFNREKYRIRMYNDSNEVINVERKSKFGEYVCKESAPLSLEEYTAILAGDFSFLLQREERLLHEFYAALTTRHYRPSVIVDYWREAYVYTWGNVRITFDKKLSAAVNTYDVFDPNLTLEEVLPTELTIMEVKFDSFLPEHIRMLISPKSHVRSSISKYVLCREKTLQHFKE
ncbi:polyphosphate polymerase domain-containing protein [Sporosarcina saromensis]|uniref:Polyphosphate polymerase domain-containing protein n=1 Tax=Sporosarcina saromensis TaxID=359365 RepID=A0ABU4G7W7_9BACL|nr:polyphosphate polymerase domain-containing protein [Sporosarcina saromensis]MDW0113070.1 polyphosphate polymerase domain-containing protein [Sporosarcina saromensis]